MSPLDWFFLASLGAFLVAVLCMELGERLEEERSRQAAHERLRRLFP